MVLCICIYTYLCRDICHIKMQIVAECGRGLVWMMLFFGINCSVFDGAGMNYLTFILDINHCVSYGILI